MRVVLTMLLVLLALPIPRGARAEIHIASSVEQMCVEADVVVIGTITEMKRVEGLGKKLDGVQLPGSLQVEKFLKGEGLYDTVPDTLFFTAGGLHEQRFQKLVGERVLIFFRRTHQAYSLGENSGSYEHWLLHEGGTAPFVVELDALPAQDVFTAGDFSQPASEKVLVKLCREVVAKQVKQFGEQEMSQQHPPPKLLACPPDSAAAGVLYEGSSTYLYVPGFLFPNAKDEL